MGLDGVELLLAVEETFQISIQDDEATQVRTVGDLQKLVAQKLGLPQGRDSMTGHVFYALRRSLMDTLHAGRNDIRPETSLEGLIPLEKRRSVWDSLSKSMGFQFPSFRFPPAMRWLFCLVGFGSPLVAVPMGSFAVLSVGRAWALGVFGPVVVLIAMRVLSGYANRYSQEPFTVGDLTKILLTMNFGRIASEFKSWNEKDMLETVRDLVVRQLGVKPEEVVPSAHFVDDLGMD